MTLPATEAPRAPPSAGLLAGLSVLLLAAFALRLGVALALPSQGRPDEIFQNLEPAFGLLTGDGIVTWEWRQGVRSVLFPGFLSGLIWLGTALGFGPAGYLALIWALLAALSTSIVAAGMWFGWRAAGAAGAVLCGVLLAVWPDLVWLGPKTLIEVQAGHLLPLAMWLAATRGARPGTGRLVATGLLLGLAFALRFLYAPALGVVAIWACRLSPRAWLVLAASAAVPVAALGVTDWIAWGTPFQTIWRLYEANIVDGVVREFGDPLPVTWYLSHYAQAWGAAAVLLGVAATAGAREARLPALVGAAILLSHSALSHKEATYIYPALPCLLILAGVGTLRELRRLDAKLGADGPGWQRMVTYATLGWAAVALTTGSGGASGRTGRTTRRICRPAWRCARKPISAGW